MISWAIAGMLTRFVVRVNGGSMLRGCAHLVDRAERCWNTEAEIPFELLCRSVSAGIKRQHFRRFCSQRKQPSARMRYPLYTRF